MITTKSYGPRRTFAGGTRRTKSTGSIATQAPRTGGYGTSTSDTSAGPPFTANNPWTMFQTGWAPYRASGQTASYVYTDWLIVPTLWRNTSGPGQSISSAWVTKALANVNPSKPAVNLANFVFELRELPRMTRDLGRVLLGGSRASDVPGSYLAWQFGWKPLEQDLRTLLTLGEFIAASQKRFAELAVTRRLKGRLGYTTRVLSQSQAVDIQGSESLTAEVRETTRTWFVALWGHKDPLPTFPSDGFAAFWTALGGNQPISAIWNSLPWSWLIDYFLDVSTFLEATEGLTANKPAIVCVMQEITEDRPVLNWKPPIGITVVPGAYHSVAKRRRVDTDPQARITWNVVPWVSHLDILGTLVAARMLRRAETRA